MSKLDLIRCITYIIYVLGFVLNIRGVLRSNKSWREAKKIMAKYSLALTELENFKNGEE